MITVTYSTTIADIEAFVDHELRTTLRKRLLISGWITGTAIGVACYLFLMSQLHHSFASASVALFLTLLVAYAMPGVTRDQQRKAIRRTYRGASDPALGPQRLTLTPEALL